jgi:hypothetical protein
MSPLRSQSIGRSAMRDGRISASGDRRHQPVHQIVATQAADAMAAQSGVFPNDRRIENLVLMALKPRANTAQHRVRLIVSFSAVSPGTPGLATGNSTITAKAGQGFNG